MVEIHQKTDELSETSNPNATFSAIRLAVFKENELECLNVVLSFCEFLLLLFLAYHVVLLVFTH
jgi:hypothetical protein